MPVLGIQDGGATDLGRAQGVHHEVDGVFGVGNNVDLFAVEFTDDGLNPGPFHSHASPHRVDVLVARGHGDLGSLARISGSGPDGHRPVVDFRHFHFKQLGEQGRVNAGNDDLGTSGGFLHLDDDHTDSVAHGEALQARLLPPGKSTLCRSQVDNHVGALGPLHQAGDHLADPLAVFFEDALPFRLANLLQNHLLGRLGGNAPQDVGGFLYFHLSVDRGIGIDSAGRGQGDLVGGVGDGFNDLFDRVNLDPARVLVEGGGQFLGGLVVLAGGHQNCILDGADHNFRIDSLFLAEKVDVLVEQGAHECSVGLGNRATPFPGQNARSRNPGGPWRRLPTESIPGLHPSAPRPRGFPSCRAAFHGNAATPRRLRWWRF